MPARIVFSPNQVDEIIRLYKSGVVCEKLAPMFGVSTPTIAKLLRRNNIAKNKYTTNPGTRGKISPDQEKEIINMYNGGFQRTEIASKFNVTPFAISTILKTNKIRIRTNTDKKGKRKLSEQQEKKVVLYFLKGKSFYELAEEFDVSDTTIRKTLKRNDVDLKKYKRPMQRNIPKPWLKFMR
jgi:transposase